MFWWKMGHSKRPCPERNQLDGLQWKQCRRKKRGQLDALPPAVTPLPRLPHSLCSINLWLAATFFLSESHRANWGGPPIGDWLTSYWALASHGKWDCCKTLAGRTAHKSSKGCRKTKDGRTERESLRLCNRIWNTKDSYPLKLFIFQISSTQKW